ncbi:unnamed protein product [Penicillium glandicola]
MLKRIRHTLRCFPRRYCDCDDDSQSLGDEPNRPLANPPARVLRQRLPKNIGKIPDPTDQPQPKSEGEGEDGSEDGDSSDDYFPPAPPPSEVPLSTEVSHTGITPAMSEANVDDSSSGYDAYSLSTRNPNLYSPPETPSDGDFYSVTSKSLHTGITPELSDANLSESQYESFPESGESSRLASVLTTGEYNIEEEEYNGADEGSLDLNQEDDAEMYDGPGEPEVSDYSSRSWLSTSSDRRRRRSLESQARADAERALRGSSGSSGSSKRRRLAGPSETAGTRVRTGIEPTVKEVTRYKNTGAQYQAWIDDPQEPGCQIQPATLTIEQLTDETQQLPWAIHESYFTVEPMALEGGDVESMNIARGGPRYRYTHLQRDPGPNTLEANEFEHRVARGVLVAERIYREDGPHWNEVARAQYLLDFNLNTLRHVLFTDIENEETAPYIRHELYPRHGVLWPQASTVDCMVFEHGSVEYQELLGTKLGKGVACLILSSFPRGTMKITRIVTWSNTTLPQMRFEIEPVIGVPIALATVA